MWFIGDVHGNTKGYFNLIDRVGMDQSIQLGDMQMGFINTGYPLEWDSNHRFIRGNHDNPQECRDHPNYIGDFGYLPEQGIYYISGAWSIDHKVRMPGIDWWDDEELDYKEFQLAIEEIKEHKPKIIITHDCPDEARAQMFTFREVFQTKTGGWLQAAFEEYQPEVWIFGHYHRSKQEFIKNTHFICLQELEACEVPDIKW